tara:strand:+ start:1307 stop:1672 length:366 start_codon:yes stop_codon:yes gene_type:complete
MSYTIWKVRDAIQNLVGTTKEWTLRGSEVKDESDFYSKFFVKTGVDEKDCTVSTNDPDVHKVLWADVLVKIKEVESLEYQHDRRRSYPEIGVQLDYIYHNGIDKWKTDIVDPIKTKYPKPS